MDHCRHIRHRGSNVKLQSYAEGKWHTASAGGKSLLSAVDGTAVASISSQGLDFAVRVDDPLVAGAESSFFSRATEGTGPTEIDEFDAAATVVIPDAGHMLHFEQPEQLAAALEKFLVV